MKGPGIKLKEEILVRVKALLAVVALAAPGILFGTEAARADLNECPNNYVCLWGNNDFKWLIARRAHGGSNYISPGVNDEMDSWANRSATHTGCMAEHANGGGDKQTMPRNSKDNDVAPWNSDEVSSYRSASGC